MRKKSNKGYDPFREPQAVGLRWIGFANGLPRADRIAGFRAVDSDGVRSRYPRRRISGVCVMSGSVRFHPGGTAEKFVPAIER